MHQQWYYRVLYLYYDKDADGASKTGCDVHQNNWFIARTRPNTAAFDDLDRDGGCNHQAATFYADSTTPPPRAQWNSQCGENGMASDVLTMAPLCDHLVATPFSYTFQADSWTILNSGCGDGVAKMRVEVRSCTAPRKGCPCDASIGQTFPKVETVLQEICSSTETTTTATPSTTTTTTITTTRPALSTTMLTTTRTVFSTTMQTALADAIRTAAADATSAAPNGGGGIEETVLEVGANSATGANVEVDGMYVGPSTASSHAGDRGYTTNSNAEGGSPGSPSKVSAGVTAAIVLLALFLLGVLLALFLRKKNEAANANVDNGVANPVYNLAQSHKASLQYSSAPPTPLVLMGTTADNPPVHRYTPRATAETPHSTAGNAAVAGAIDTGDQLYLQPGEEVFQPYLQPGEDVLFDLNLQPCSAGVGAGADIVHVGGGSYDPLHGAYGISDYDPMHGAYGVTDYDQPPRRNTVYAKPVDELVTAQVAPAGVLGHRKRARCARGDAPAGRTCLHPVLSGELHCANHTCPQPRCPHSKSSADETCPAHARAVSAAVVVRGGRARASGAYGFGARGGVLGGDDVSGGARCRGGASVYNGFEMEEEV